MIFLLVHWLKNVVHWTRFNMLIWSVWYYLLIYYTAVLTYKNTEQGKAVITFLDAILDKTLRSTVALLAARGRGKSAALGLAISGAIAAGYWWYLYYSIIFSHVFLTTLTLKQNLCCRYSNIFVTAPSPENLKTLFEFICKGFDMLEYKVCSIGYYALNHNFTRNGIHWKEDRVVKWWTTHCLTLQNYIVSCACCNTSSFRILFDMCMCIWNWMDECLICYKTHF